MSNKSGVSEQAISIPKGGGALAGIGETFSPNLYTGTGNFTVPLALPPGRGSLQPSLSLVYSTGSGNGAFGLGWSLSVPSISRKVSRGVPRYDDERDTFLLSGAEDLIATGGDQGSRRYRPRTDGLFARIEHHRSSESNYWEIRSKEGLRSFYGTPDAAGADSATVANPGDRTRVFTWKLTRTMDPFGNSIEYQYERDTGTDGPHTWDQLYLSGLRYVNYEDGQGETRFLATVTFGYAEPDARPDPFSDHRAGFEIRTRRRCSRIRIATHAGQERLLRTYDLVYLDERAAAGEVPASALPPNGASLLSRVIVSGHDGARVERLPPLEFGYSAGLIQPDYWEAPSTGGSTDVTTDRRGLTGSARLLQDIYRLDQYAFDSNRRKLQLSRTFDLAESYPLEFQEFRQTGVLVFETPLAVFDREFPGHYLRLISRVSTSVVALTPPSFGVRATLTSAGISRVVIPGQPFQLTTMRREPEQVALTSPAGATGIFELDTQTDLLRPFEGSGVDTLWEFRMPKAANPFDYRSMATVLVTIEYTALHSYEYQQQVIQGLSSRVTTDRAFSFRSEFSDQWYDLHNPDLTQQPMRVRFAVRREDFAPNLKNVRIAHAALFFAGNNLAEMRAELRLTPASGWGTVGGSAMSNGNVISTRAGNAASWTAMIGLPPEGEWELALDDMAAVRGRFTNSEIQDLLLVLTVAGETPPWMA